MKWITRFLKFLIWESLQVPLRLLSLLFFLFFSKKRNRRRGYVMRRTRSGQMRYEHRQVAEEILGRRLRPGEVVHHINGRRADNRPSNLCVMSRAHHDQYHEWYRSTHRALGKYPRRSTQLNKLKTRFNGILLEDKISRGRRSG